jgi:hypothetical protein
MKGRVLEGEKKVGQNRKGDKCKLKRDELIWSGEEREEGLEGKM